MPVFSSHFTVSHLDHRRQAIAEHIDTFLQLMADFGSGWTVLYNGPKCGASAPDHLHFQIVPSGQMPIEKEIRERKRLALMTQVDGVFLYRVRDLGREVILLEGDDPMAVGRAFKRFLDALKKVLSIDEEPMMNIAGLLRRKEMASRDLSAPKTPSRRLFQGRGCPGGGQPGRNRYGGRLDHPCEKGFRTAGCNYGGGHLRGSIPGRKDRGRGHRSDGTSQIILATMIPERVVLCIRYR